jgi:Uma2 family endonuclease
MSVAAVMPKRPITGHRVLLHTKPRVNLTDDQLFELCQANPELRIERTAEGDLIVMPPVTGETGWRNAELTAALVNWARQDGTGVAFDSSTGFVLANGAMRSPDAAWVRRERLGKLSPEQKRTFIPLCPDFVVEIRSQTDAVRTLRAKMEEVIANGAQLGWLIDPSTRRVSIYRPDKSVETLLNPSAIAADPVLPGFVFEVGRIWEVGF